MSIPYGYCHYGYGEKTTIAPFNKRGCRACLRRQKAEYRERQRAARAMLEVEALENVNQIGLGF